RRRGPGGAGRPLGRARAPGAGIPLVRADPARDSGSGRWAGRTDAGRTAVTNVAAGSSAALPEAVRAFDAMAGGFDKRFGSWASVAAQRRAVRRELLRTFPPDALLLELGGGTGEDALCLARHGRGVVVTDGAPAMVRRRREQGRAPGYAGRRAAGEGRSPGVHRRTPIHRQVPGAADGRPPVCPALPAAADAGDWGVRSAQCRGAHDLAVPQSARCVGGRGPADRRPTGVAE